LAGEKAQGVRVHKGRGSATSKQKLGVGDETEVIILPNASLDRGKDRATGPEPVSGRGERGKTAKTTDGVNTFAQQKAPGTRSEKKSEPKRVGNREKRSTTGRGSARTTDSRGATTLQHGNQGRQPSRKRRALTQDSDLNPNPQADLVPHYDSQPVVLRQS